MIVTMPAMTKMTAISQRMNSMERCYPRASARKRSLTSISTPRWRAISGRRASVVLEHGLDRRDDTTCDFRDRTIAVDRNDSAVMIEPLEERTGLVLEHVESLADHLGVVVGATGEHRAAVIAQPASLVTAHRATALRTHETRAEPFGRLTFGDHQLHDGVETVRRQQGVERDRLIDGARKPVEHEPVALDVVSFEAAGQGHQDEAVGGELPRIDVLLRTPPDGRAVLDLGSQQLARGDVRNSQDTREARALGPFARARATEHCDTNGTARHHLPTPRGAPPWLD